MRGLHPSHNQAYWQELIQKEAAARVAWKINYGHKYLKERPKPRKQGWQAPLRSDLEVSVSATSSPCRKEAWAEWPATKGLGAQPPKEVHVQGTPRKGDRILAAQRAIQTPAGQTKPEGLEMKKVPPSTLQLLFQGISHDGEGRALYLRERYRQKPEEKFSYPILSSWDYGWHVGDIVKDTGTPSYARSQPITKSFYIKSDIFHVARRTDQIM